MKNQLAGKAEGARVGISGREWTATIACIWERMTRHRFLMSSLLGISLSGSVMQAQSLKPSEIQFTDVTAKAGITFKHFKGNKGISINLEEFGPGVCVADFDGDGWPDIYFVNGRDRYDRGISVRNALYRNNRDGTFTDVTEKAGVPGTGYGLGCIWGGSQSRGA